MMFKKKKEQTFEQSFVNAVINIRMPEMNSMIHSEISLECSRQRMGNSPEITEGTEKIVWRSERLR